MANPYREGLLESVCGSYTPVGGRVAAAGRGGDARGPMVEISAGARSPRSVGMTSGADCAGVITGRQLGKVFSWMRPDDLVFNYWISNYLTGDPPPVFDILAVSLWRGSAVSANPVETRLSLASSMRNRRGPRVR